jgi:hypothetical protein
MSQLKPTKTIFTVSDFLERQRIGSLELKPFFQRGQVWQSKVKSLLIDTVAKGLPVPVILLRKVQSLKTLESKLEVVDGQQRLRTILSFVDPKSLKDFDPSRDIFTVLPEHNEEIGKLPFSALHTDAQRDILGYELSVHIFPPETSDADVLLMFSRLNSTGLSLNKQELRNAEYYGKFKTLSYRLAFRYIEKWRDWKIFSDQDMARMVEVENVSDYILAMIEGIQGKSQSRLSAAYKKYDEKMPNGRIIEERFEKVISEIDRVFGAHLPQSSIRSQALFYSLFTVCYDHLYELGSPIARVKAGKLPSAAIKGFLNLDTRLRSSTVPVKYEGAFGRSTTDIGRRKLRHEYFKEMLAL